MERFVENWGGRDGDGREAVGHCEVLEGICGEG